jgi:hypothetical protein
MVDLLVHIYILVEGQKLFTIPLCTPKFGEPSVHSFFHPQT